MNAPDYPSNKDLKWKSLQKFERAMYVFHKQFLLYKLQPINVHKTKSPLTDRNSIEVSLNQFEFTIYNCLRLLYKISKYRSDHQK